LCRSAKCQRTTLQPQQESGGTDASVVSSSEQPRRYVSIYLTRVVVHLLTLSNQCDQSKFDSFL